MLTILPTSTTIHLTPTPTYTSTIPSPTTGTVAVTETITPTPTYLIPDVKSICPANHEIPLDDQDLPSTSHLILYDNETYSLWTYGGDEPILKEVKTDAPKPMYWRGIEISPNGQWFSFYSWQKDRDSSGDGPYFELWVSSINGDNSWRVLSDQLSTTDKRRVEEEIIEIWNYPPGRGCPERILEINPFTLESWKPLDVPYMGKPICYMPLVSSPDRTQIITLYILDDLASGESHEIFPWLQDMTFTGVSDTLFEWTEIGVNIVLIRPYGLAIVFDLPLNSFYDTNINIQKVRLPGEIDQNVITWWSPESDLIGLDIVVEDLERSDDQLLTRFYVYDSRNNILLDYCLSRSTIGNDSGRIYFSYASKANKFLTWPVYLDTSSGTQFSSNVLNLSTGYISSIEGFHVYGWGEINNEDGSH
jgi:hypothetical protein